ncbi:helix-turn-helix domain-containing protein [Aeromonas schubertii]|uniref:Helix-turn-helix domain-containing protein n=1 Tax=Aeromonas schubertii TaxID=652 RepID=A0ABS7V5L9_9GAMM|nr:S24 family peptidase [Aeromonas schubertii]MBZ6064667.1 helix-turn-helix domain-containing protein [Aeromonas schubertii]
MSDFKLESYDREAFARRLSMAIGDESRRSFAGRVGISSTSINKYEKLEALPNVERLVAIAVAAGVDLRWLACGDDWESVLGSANSVPELSGDAREQSPSYDRQGLKPSPILETEFTFIDSYQVFASAGHGQFVTDEQKAEPMAFRTDWLKREGLAADRLAVIRAKGDSMEPTISDNDIILVHLCNGDTLRDGLYVLRIGDSLLVKRLQFDVLGGIKVISDNPGYENQVITKDQRGDITIVGRVAWAGKKF